jgi:hypothetical protein
MSKTTDRLVHLLEEFVRDDDDYTTQAEFLHNVQGRIGEALRKGDYRGGPSWTPPCMRKTEDVDGLARTLWLNVGENSSARPKK